VNNNLIPTEVNKAQPAGLIPLTAPLIKRFVLNFSRVLETIVTMINDGRITAVVAMSEPKIPALLNPAKVATLTPTGPGVIDETASIFVNSAVEYQWNLSAISYKNGIVAYPPPNENMPI